MIQKLKENANVSSHCNPFKHTVALGLWPFQELEQMNIWAKNT